MATQYTEEFKNDAVRYWKEHPELGIAKCAKNLGISKTALSNWRKIYWTYECFVYLTSIMDLYSRKIISWVLSNTLEAKYVVKAVEKAKRRRGVEKPLILHTDRGIQYVCREYVEATAGMKRSYSKKAYPWDNACIESFHALIKREWLNRFKIKNYDHAYKLVFEYIETFYNTVRIHSHCGYLSPNEYENEYEQKLNKMEKLAG